MLKSFVTLIITLIVGVVFMAIGNDFFNGFTDIGVIFAVAVAGALIVFFLRKLIIKAAGNGEPAACFLLFFILRI